VSYEEEEDTCVSYEEEEDTCVLVYLLHTTSIFTRHLYNTLSASSRCDPPLSPTAAAAPAAAAAAASSSSSAPGWTSPSFCCCVDFGNNWG
jgi:hypothetical protein